MQDEIKVHVVKYPDRANYVMRYLDPLTGKQVSRSTKTRKKSEAEKAAGKWEAELREGRYAKPSKMAWEDFRAYYSANALPGLARRSVETYESTLDVFEQRLRPQRLADVTTARITAFVTELRTDGRSEATIAHHLRHLKAAMRWANQQGLLPVLPVFAMPKRLKGAKVMRGRPITLEEFERMLAAVPKAIEARPTTSGGGDTVAAWRFYLRGLWASGLRLTESLTLRWDNAPGAIVVDLAGRRPMLRIPAEAEKGNTDRLLPMTPEFAQLLQGVPERERHGRVFKLLTPTGATLRGGTVVVSKAVAAIGTKAGVVVDERTKAGETVRKFASAHDLRRAFGQRWAAKVMPTVLRELMRHANIATTMSYYVVENAEATADALWGSSGTSVSNSEQSSKNTGRRRLAKQPIKQG